MILVHSIYQSAILLPYKGLTALLKEELVYMKKALILAGLLVFSLASVGTCYFQTVPSTISSVGNQELLPLVSFGRYTYACRKCGRTHSGTYVIGREVPYPAPYDIMGGCPAGGGHEWTRIQ